jgi:quinol monooxygenase YgiN
MIIVVAKSVVKEDMISLYKQETVKLIELTRKESGCIAYDLCEDVNNPNILTFIEKWESQEHLDAHMNSEHFKEIVPKLKDMRESSELNIYKPL